VFYSFADGSEGGRYYDVHKIENMRHQLTIIAYVNAEALSISPEFAMAYGPWPSTRTLCRMTCT